MSDAPELIVKPARVDEIARSVKSVGVFCFDLEFVSEGRYVPELALFQVSWLEEGQVQAHVVDCTEVDPSPLVNLVADPQVQTVVHSGRQDLGLLHARFDCVGHNIFDTQIAAAFVGLGDQIGLSNLLAEFNLGTLDKSQQFTKWLKRPLSDKQLHYALSDVLYLPALQDILVRQLREKDRLRWVSQESAVISTIASTDVPPELAYQSVKGYRSLRGRALASLVGLAAWRQQIVAKTNKPPSWIIPDRTMIDIAKRKPTSAKALSKFKGMPNPTVDKWGSHILSALNEVDPKDVNEVAKLKPQSDQEQLLTGIIHGFVGGICLGEKIAPRFVATKRDAESLARWISEGLAEDSKPEIDLLTGWRQELVGDKILSWVAGKSSASYDKDFLVRFDQA